MGSTRERRHSQSTSIQASSFVVVAEDREEAGPGPGDDLQDPEGQVYFHTQSHLKGQCREIQIKKIFNQKKNKKIFLNTFEK